MDHDTAQLGRDIAEQRDEILIERQVRTKRVKAGRAAMGALGFAPRSGDDYDEERIEAARRLEKQLQQFSEENSK